MSEVRRDIVTDTWVIVDTDNDKLPKLPGVDFKPSRGCPFCAGNEAQTPPELYAIRNQDSADGPGWKVRVIPNIKPILQEDGELKKTGVGVYDMVSGVGANEVIIETPEHIINFFELSEEQIGFVLKVYQQRIIALQKDSRIRYVLIFKNHRPQAGASTIEHTHSDLIGLPAIPIRIKQKLNGAREYYGFKERCIFCDIIKQELEMADRLVFQSENFVVITPYASRFPFEMLIIPREHSYSYKLTDEFQFKDLAGVLKKVCKILNDVVDDPPYNLILNDCPNLLPRQDYWKTIKADFHWHIELTPRLYRTTGFELGTGFYINRYAPERAAAVLRKNL